MSALTTNPRLPSTWALYRGELRRQWTGRAVLALFLAVILAAGVQLAFTWALRPSVIAEGYRPTPRRKISDLLAAAASPLYSRPVALWLNEVELRQHGVFSVGVQPERRLIAAYLLSLPLAIFQLLAPAYAAVAFSRFRRDDGERWARQGYSAEQVLLGMGTAAMTPLAIALLGSIVVAHSLATSRVFTEGLHPLPDTESQVRLVTSAVLNAAFLACVSGKLPRTWNAMATCYAFACVGWPLVAYSFSPEAFRGWQVRWGYAERLEPWIGLACCQLMALAILAFPSVLHIQSRLEAACSASVE
ncbi:MAG: hypothetical protein ACK47B_15305 [Armatimonadota bacterium]